HEPRRRRRDVPRTRRRSRLPHAPRQRAARPLAGALPGDLRRPPDPRDRGAARRPRRRGQAPAPFAGEGAGVRAEEGAGMRAAEGARGRSGAGPAAAAREPAARAGPSGRELLRVERLSRHFGGYAAVAELSFHVDEGEVVGLVGPNGAGKTTTFNVVTGFLGPTTGRVYFRGEDVTGLPPHALARPGLVRTF